MNSYALPQAHRKAAATRLSRLRWWGARDAAQYMPSGLSGGQTSGLSRIEVRPPSLRHAPTPILQRVLFWLIAPSPQEASPPLNRLPGVQREFLLALSDLSGEARDTLHARIARARSLRELWHMRLDVYNLIAVVRSEYIAAERLARLNRHFPTRAPRLSTVGEPG